MNRQTAAGGAIRAAGAAFVVAAGVLLWQLALRAGVAGERLELAELWVPMAEEFAWLFGLAAAAALAGLRIARGHGSFTEAALTALAFGLLVGARIEAAEWLRASIGSGVERSPFLCAGGSDAASGESATWFDALLLQPIALALAWIALRGRAIARLIAGNGRRLAWTTAGLALAGGTAHCAEEAPLDLAEVRAHLTGPCANGGPQRSFDVSAIPVKMTLNRFGDHDPGAFMFVLDERIPEVRAEEEAPLPRVSLGLRTDAIQPLVLRANVGECVEINFTNRLSTGNASFHVHGLPHSVLEAGGFVGRNPDTSAPPGQRLTYRFAIPDDPDTERAYYIHDHGASRQRTAHGLFGALVVEPAGSEHLHPETGEPLTGNNWEAIIVPPGGPGFREYVLIYHEVGDEDFDEILDANGDDLPVIDDTADVYRPAARAINYRSEPHRNRLLIKPDKSLGYNSYTFGDPATPVPRSYLGEPTKTRLLHGGSEVFHVHHLHGGGVRWRANPRAEAPDFALGLQKRPIDHAAAGRLDSQNIGPGTSFNLEHECGAGGCQQVAGDFLFHCHIGHHYIAGMWGFWRVFDTLQPDLAPIPDRVSPPASVNSLGLVGRVIEGRTLVPRAQLTDPQTQRALEDWIEAQLPPPGVPFHKDDATVWDWVRVDTDDGPLYLGEPETNKTWANYSPKSPGQRPEIAFNPQNGRYAFPLFQPQLGKRPPFAPNGHTGAPWLGEDGSALRPDGLCPNDEVLHDPRRKVRRYPISSIAVPIPITRDEVDPDGLLFVLNEDKDAVRANMSLREPLTIRSNAGDCVRAIFTNEVPDNDFNRNYSKGNLHSHFVQFDVQSSDGANAGFTFEAAVRPYETENRTLTASAWAGTSRLEVNHTVGLRPGIWLGIGLGEGMCGDRECTEIRRITSLGANEIVLEEPLELDHAVGEAVGVEFAQYLWYSDVDSGTVFWHDHVNFHGWDHGLFAAHIIEPSGSTWHDPQTGEEIRSGSIADIRAPYWSSVGSGVWGSFREFVMFLHSNNPVAEGTINMRAEPIYDRLGEGGQPHLALSSVKHGDPITPVPRAYVGDPFVVRMVGVVQQTGSIRFPGNRFHLERWAEESAFADAVPVGISERFDFVLDGGAGGKLRQAGDYLYYSGFGRHFEAGAWGILRVHDTLRSDLQPLPGRALPAEGSGFPVQSFTGQAPLRTTDPGNPCPPEAPVRRYNIKGTRADILFHDESENNGGQVFVIYTPQDVEEVTEPIVLRVAEGECLEIGLVNDFDEPSAPTIGQLLFDPQRSYGPPIGYNYDSTTPAGGIRTYRFYADRELATSFGMDLTDLERGEDGAWFGVVVEPAGSTWTDPRTGTSATGVVADVASPTRAFREMVVLMQDQDPILGQDTMPYPTEARGFSGFNYAADLLEPRLEEAGTAASVFSSAIHGDPRNVLHAHVDDPVTFRVAQPWGEQLHVFGIEGHQWPAQPSMSGCEHVSSAIVGPGTSFDAFVVDGAGAGIGAIGDFMFYDMRQPFLEAGMWGLLRVLPAGDPSIPALPWVPPTGGGGSGGYGGGYGSTYPPKANAGTDVFAMERDVVTLDGSGSWGNFQSVQWSQLSGPPVTMDDPTSLTPSFVTPAGHFLFQLRLQGPSGVSYDTVYLWAEENPEPADRLTATADFRTQRKEWNVSGTATVTAGNQVLLRLDGVPFAAATVAADGSWSFRQRNATTIPAAGDTVEVRSTAGGILENVPVNVSR